MHAAAFCSVAYATLPTRLLSTRAAVTSKTEATQAGKLREGDGGRAERGRAGGGDRRPAVVAAETRGDDGRRGRGQALTAGGGRSGLGAQCWTLPTSLSLPFLFVFLLARASSSSPHPCTLVATHGPLARRVHLSRRVRLLHRNGQV